MRDTNHLKASIEQRSLIDHAAALIGKKRSSFMLEAAHERAQTILLDQVLFQLDAEKFQRFTEQLDASATPNVGLEQLMTVQAPWSSEPL